MSEKLKLLTDKIYEEGIFKAREESERLLKKASEEAARIREQAQRERDALLKEAEEQAAAQRRKTEAELRLAARKASTKLSEDLQRLVTEKVIEQPVQEALSSPEVIAQLLVACMQGLEQTGAGNWQVRLSAGQEKQVREALEKGKHSALAQGLRIANHNGVGSGFELAPEGSGYTIRFDKNFFVKFLSGFLTVETRSWIAEENAT